MILSHFKEKYSLVLQKANVKMSRTTSQILIFNSMHYKNQRNNELFNDRLSNKHVTNMKVDFLKKVGGLNQTSFIYPV